ncbi:MAG: hypothetical protein KTR31_30850 [Myxococcales bacterium]|nr:hypothetical protein [Myxococcales bacterium]
MARSLTVSQEEAPRTSWLFVAFVVLGSAVLVGAWTTGPISGAETQPAAVSTDVTP